MLLKTRPRDVEETLLQLINDDDQVVAAAAIDAARQHKIWALADDIEHVLAHRDVRDWYVFEAASWALAEKRMPAERRRELWHEPLPAAELATRLRELPLFASVSVDELFRIASTARQVRHDPGSVLLEEGEVPETIHFLLDGRVVASSRDGAPHSIVAPAALGFSEALSGHADARDDAHRGPGGDAGDAPERAAHAARRQHRPRERTVRHAVGDAAGRNRDRVAGAVGTDLARAGTKRPLASREGAGAAARTAVLAGRGRRDAAARRHRRKRCDLTPGSTLFTESAAPALWLVLSGELALTSSTADVAPRIVRSGDVIGALEVMSGRPLGLAGKVNAPGIALRLEREDLFSLLGERPELLRQIFSALFRVDAARLSAFSGAAAALVMRVTTFP